MTQADITRLLLQAQDAHHEYEENELDGEYDEEWPAWYAAYVIEHGLSAHLSQPVSVDRLTEFLIDCNARYEESSAQESWHEFAAAAMLAEFS